jgi:hypothetical protein
MMTMTVKEIAWMDDEKSDILTRKNAMKELEFVEATARWVSSGRKGEEPSARGLERNTDAPDKPKGFDEIASGAQ